MLHLEIAKRRMMKYGGISSLIGSYIPLPFYYLEQLLTEIFGRQELVKFYMFRKHIWYLNIQGISIYLARTCLVGSFILIGCQHIGH
jgi:hypothetical protein